MTSSDAAERRRLPLNFQYPNISTVGSAKLASLADAALASDPAVLARLRVQFAEDRKAFEDFTSGIRRLADGDAVGASETFLQILDGQFYIAGSMCQVLALLVRDEISPAISLYNTTIDLIRAAESGSASGLFGDRALAQETRRCLQAAESAKATAGEWPLPRLFRIILSYPRSGNTYLRQFLSFAFSTPPYTVYSGVSRIFSRQFHDPADRDAVFLKDHVLREEYFKMPIVAPVRDGRDAVVSLARFLYAEGSHNLVHKGELASFISFVADRMPYGFWGDHTLALLKAKARGSDVRWVRYEQVFNHFSKLVELAEEIAGSHDLIRVDEAAFVRFVATEKIRLAAKSDWSEHLRMPQDSYLPANWTIGGGSIDWRTAFDGPARRRFHDLGGTEALVRMGYETDEDWWRQG